MNTQFTKKIQIAKENIHIKFNITTNKIIQTKTMR